MMRWRQNPESPRKMMRTSGQVCRSRRTSSLRIAAACCAPATAVRVPAAQPHRWAWHAAAILKLLVRRLRQTWPEVRIIFRGDSGFCRQRIINWCERSGVHYIIGLARNAKLEAMVEYAQLAMHDEYQRTGTKQRLIDEFSYAAQSWPHERRAVTRLEWG